jgi:ABC-type uncharacterized transport system permease subunit
LGTLEQKQIFFVSDLAAILRALVTDLSVVTLIALALVALTWWVLWRTTFGLRLRSCGESPVARRPWVSTSTSTSSSACWSPGLWPASVAATSPWSLPTSTATARPAGAATSVLPP